MSNFEIISKSSEVLSYLSQADKNFYALGYTEQGIRHASHTASLVEKILSGLNYSQEEIDIGKIAGFMHDIGCAVTYIGHEEIGAFMNYVILKKYGIGEDKIFEIMQIVGSHENVDYLPISDIAAAVILSDKTDVNRSRVTKKDFNLFDQHDRVHYAVVDNILELLPQNNTLVLKLKIDDTICSVIEYFEIFLPRIKFCQKASSKLGLRFDFYINEIKYL